VRERFRKTGLFKHVLYTVFGRITEKREHAAYKRKGGKSEKDAPGNVAVLFVFASNASGHVGMGVH